MQPRVSVVIPAYNGGQLLRDAINSVLNQSYRNVEVVVVDDCSKDDTRQIAQQYSDSRLVVLSHSRNLGPDCARKTGVGASSGEVIAFLDQDDLFHPEKTSEHIEYLRAHPEVGASYNSFAVVAPSAREVLSLSRPPHPIVLSDILLGFPLPPSVWVMRREWALLEELWEEATFMRGSEVALCGRLLLAGCQMGRVDRVLNYRRVHPGRRIDDIEAAAAEELKSQEILLSDPRCPPDLAAFRDSARANTFLEFAYVAFDQGDPALGWKLAQEAVQLRQDLLRHRGVGFLNYLLLRSTRNWMEDHEPALRTAWSCLPGGYELLRARYLWLVQQGWLLRISRAALWGSVEEAKAIGERCPASTLNFADIVADTICHDVALCSREFGADTARSALRRVAEVLACFCGQRECRRFTGRCHFGLMFQRFDAGSCGETIQEYVRAVVRDPAYLTNRGGLSLTSKACLMGITRRWRPANSG